MQILILKFSLLNIYLQKKKKLLSFTTLCLEDSFKKNWAVLEVMYYEVFIKILVYEFLEKGFEVFLELCFEMFFYNTLNRGVLEYFKIFIQKYPLCFSFQLFRVLFFP